MAKILFGPSSMRINIDKAWRHLNKPEVIHGDIEERKAFIYKVKRELGIDDFLKRSSRKMAHGPLRYWNYPVWVIQPKRPIIAANPNHFPIEVHSSMFGAYDKDDIEAMISEKLMQEQENMMKRYQDSPALNIKKTMKKMHKALDKSLGKMFNEDSEAKTEENKEGVVEAKGEEVEETGEVEEEPIDFNEYSIDFIQDEKHQAQEESDEEVEDLLANENGEKHK